MSRLRKRRWGVEYPPHDPPRSRPDIRVNQLLALTCIAAVVVLAVLGCLR
jgi:hypothetical protein